MGYYSDPTASAALGNINQEFARMVKRAKHLRRLYERKKLSEEELEQEQRQFRGIYRTVLTRVLAASEEELKTLFK